MAAGFHVHGLQVFSSHFFLLLLVLLAVLKICGVIVGLFLCDTMFVVYLTIPALVGHPIVRQRRLKSFPCQIQQTLIFWKPHSQRLNGILLDFLISWLIAIIYLFDERLRFLLLVLLIIQLVAF